MLVVGVLLLVAAAPLEAQEHRPTSRSPALGFVDVSGETSEWVASSRDKKVYYRASCPPAQAIPADDRVYFKTEKAAKKAGYKRSEKRGC